MQTFRYLLILSSILFAVQSDANDPFAKTYANYIHVKWAQLAVSPEEFSGKEIAVEGWVRLRERGDFFECDIYETSEALDFRISSKSIAVSHEALVETFGGEPFKEELPDRFLATIFGRFSFDRSDDYYRVGSLSLLDAVLAQESNIEIKGARWGSKGTP